MMVDDGCIEKQKARMSVKSWRDWVRLRDVRIESEVVWLPRMR